MVSTRGALDLLQIPTPARTVPAGKSLLYVKSDGLVYKKDPTLGEVLVEGVKLTGAQTVAGVKDFTSSPTGPTPTTSTQLAPKGYVDSQVAGMAAVGQQLGLATKTTTAAITNTSLWATTVGAIIGSLSITVTGTGRPVEIVFKAPWFSNSLGGNLNISCWFVRTTPATGGTTIPQELVVIPAVGTTGPAIHLSSEQTLTNGVTYKFEVGISTGAGNTVTIQCGTTPTWTAHWPMILKATQR